MMARISVFCALVVPLALVCAGGGCRTWYGLNPVPAKAVGAPPSYVPTELNKVSLPPYVIEPPDILLVDALRIVPKEPFHIEPLDILQVDAEGTLFDAPIHGLYQVEPGGMLNLGAAYRWMRRPMPWKNSCAASSRTRRFR